MKKKFFVLFCLSLIPLSLLFSGCNDKKTVSPEHQYDNQGYTSVCSVEYLDNSNHLITVESYYYLTLICKEITEEEYLDSTLVDAGIPVTKDSNYFASMSKNADLKTDYFIGQQFKYMLNSYREQYFIQEITKVEYRFLYVKVINNNILDIIDAKSNSHFQVFTSYFKITYFNN